MKISLTRLRADLYNIVDQVIESGIPVEVKRHGKIIKIISVEPKSKLDNLEPHPNTIVGNPEDLVHMDWSPEWSQGNDL